MKLLAKNDATSKKKLENDALIESNLRLKKAEQVLIARLNSLKNDYEPEKMKKLEEYEAFVVEINNKKSNLLKEMTDIQRHIENKKELYYGLIEKQDVLEEKMYLMTEKERKLDLREVFVVDLENKWREKQL